MRHSFRFAAEPSRDGVSPHLLRVLPTGQSIPDNQRQPLRTLLYFLLFNDFLRRPEARIRYLRDRLKARRGGPLPLDGLMRVIEQRQRLHDVTTTLGMLSAKPALALNFGPTPGSQSHNVLAGAARSRSHLSASQIRNHQSLFSFTTSAILLSSGSSEISEYQEPWDYFKDASR